MKMDLKAEVTFRMTVEEAHRMRDVIAYFYAKIAHERNQQVVLRDPPPEHLLPEHVDMLEHIAQCLPPILKGQ